MVRLIASGQYHLPSRQGDGSGGPEAPSSRTPAGLCGSSGCWAVQQTIDSMLVLSYGHQTFLQEELGSARCGQAQFNLEVPLRWVGRRAASTSRKG